MAGIDAKRVAIRKVRDKQKRLDLSGKEAVVMGLGLFTGGVESAKFLHRCGASVTVTDLKPANRLQKSIDALTDIPVRFVLAEHHTEDFRNADIVIVSPAVPRESQYIQAAREAGASVTTEMNLFFELCAASIVGVTGSNGKTTTAYLLADMLNRTARRCHLGGNIGHSLINELDHISADAIVVLELSSFQLEWLGEIGKSPNLAVVTNLTPNHLDRHGTMESYESAKRVIIEYQESGDATVLNLLDERLKRWEPLVKGELLYFANGVEVERGAYVIDGKLFLNNKQGRRLICEQGEVKLRGSFNMSNIAAAAAAADWLGAELSQIRRTALTFTGVEHRLEFVRALDGVHYFNDSIATSPESVLAAVGAFSEPILLIAGGYDKGLDYDEMAEKIASRLKALILLGDIAEKIAKSFRRADRDGTLPIHRCNSLDEVVLVARRVAESGDVVLLAPGTSSYDMFDNFAHRGTVFKQCVNTLRR